MTFPFHRGHKIHSIDGEWYYSDGEKTIGNPRDCGYCHKPDTEDGHDPCIGVLPRVMNACCGHGVNEEAYIQFNSGCIISGDKAVFLMG